MKENNKKKNSFFLKLSVCALLVCATLVVFIVPSSADSTVVYATEDYTLYDDGTMSIAGINHTFNWTNGGTNTSVMDGVYFKGTTSSYLYSYDPGTDYVMISGGQDELVDNFMLYNNVVVPVTSYISNSIDNINVYQAVIPLEVTTDNFIDIFEFETQEIDSQYVNHLTVNSVTLYARNAFDLGYIFYQLPDVTDGRVYIFDTMTVYNVPMPEESPIDSILGVFLGITEWFGDAMLSVIPAFWTGEELTVLGVLAVSGLAIAITLLLVNWIRNLLKFGG